MLRIKHGDNFFTAYKGKWRMNISFTYVLYTFSYNKHQRDKNFSFNYLESFYSAYMIGKIFFTRDEIGHSCAEKY